MGPQPVGVTGDPASVDVDPVVDEPEALLRLGETDGLDTSNHRATSPRLIRTRPPFYAQTRMIFAEPRLSQRLWANLSLV